MRRLPHFHAFSAATVGVPPLSSLTLSATSTPRRAYFWPHSEKLVPEDGRPSSFQASTVPSVRETIVREYALGPLFGARTPLCILGFFPPSSPSAKSNAAMDQGRSSINFGVHEEGQDVFASDSSGRGLVRRLIARKKALRVVLAELLSCDVKDIELGQIVLAKEMMLHRSGTPESPRMGDGLGSSAEAKQRRVNRYARRPIAARAYMDVYVAEDLFASPDERQLFAHFVQQRIVHHHSEAASFDATRTAFQAASGEEASVVEPSATAHVSDISGSTDNVFGKKGKLSAQQREAFENDMEDRARVLDSVADLLELGVVHCEVPVKVEDVDGHDYTFDWLHGKELDLPTAELVLDRWDQRLRI